MATNYPGTIDTFTNPSGTSLVTSPDHAAQHTNINDAMGAVQALLGTSSGTALFAGYGTADKPEKRAVITVGTTPYTTSGTLSSSQYLQYNGTSIVGAAASGGASFWTTMPTVTRTNDGTITIPDTGGTNNYAQIFGRQTLLKWSNGGTMQIGMSTGATYDGTSVVTITLVGNAYGTAGSAAYYCLQPAVKEDFLIPGVAGTGAITNMAKPWYVPSKSFFISGDLMVETAGTAGTTTFDVMQNGTSVYTTKLTVTTGTASFNNAVTTPTGTLSANDKITINQTAGGTAPPSDITVRQWYAPISWFYRS